MKNNKGFTLIELLAVLLILGVVMTIAVPAVSKYIANTSSEYYKALEKDVELAARDFMNDHRSGLPKETGDSCYVTNTNNLVSKDYIKKIADKKGNDCNYVVTVTRKSPSEYKYESKISCGGEFQSEQYSSVNSNLCVDGD